MSPGFASIDPPKQAQQGCGGRWKKPEKPVPATKIILVVVTYHSRSTCVIWEDKKLYWALRGNATAKSLAELPPPPTKKRLDYVTINKGLPTEHRHCIGVWDDDIHTPLGRDEFEFHTKQYTFDPSLVGVLVKRPPNTY
jgi:hypothetical protein